MNRVNTNRYKTIYGHNKKRNRNTRYTKVRGWQSTKRLQNKHNRAFMLSINPMRDLEPVKVKEPLRLTPKQLGKAPHVNTVSNKIHWYENNMHVIKGYGYTTKQTRINVTLRRIERSQRDLAYDGVGCRRRRELYRNLDKVQTVKNAA